MAEYFSGDPSPAARQVASSAMFPPLYPLLLAATGGPDPARAHAVTAACLLAALAVFGLWLDRLGRSAGEVALLVATLALLPVTLLQALEHLSENLYLLLTLGCLAAAAGVTPERTPPRRALLVAALCAGLALTTRTLGASLVAALALWLGLRRAPRLPLLLVVMLLPFAAWAVARQALGLAGSYESAFLSKLASYGPDPLHALPRAVAAQAGALLRSASGLLSHFPGPAERAFAAGIGALALWGGLRRLRRLELDALYAATYLAALLPWPFPSHAQRFLYPLLPVLLLHALEGLDAALRPLRVGRPGLARGLRLAWLALLLAAPLPATAWIVGRYREGQAREYRAFTHSPRWYARRRLEKAEADALGRRDLALAMAAVPEVVPPQACVFAVKPLELMWRSGRAAFMPPPESVPDAVFAREIRRCDHFFLAPLVSFPYRTPFYPQRRLGRALEVVRVVPGVAAAGTEAGVAGAVARRRAAMLPPETGPSRGESPWSPSE